MPDATAPNDPLPAAFGFCARGEARVGTAAHPSLRFVCSLALSLANLLQTGTLYSPDTATNEVHTTKGDAVQDQEQDLTQTRLLGGTGRRGQASSQDQDQPRTTLLDRGNQGAQQTTLLDRGGSTRVRHAATDLTQTRRRAFVDTSTPTAQHYSQELLLNRYRVMDSRGTGGFGTVLTCWDTRLQRRVAIKRIPLAMRNAAGSSNASTVAEALAEARTSSLLAHPNIVTVFDFEADANYAYLVMEYVDGVTLTELLERVEGGTLTPDECCHLVRSVAAALAYAHQNNVLHLDIKPSNIMIDQSGTVKLCDFGMATLASAAGYGDARGGTIGYMPPEQIRGDLVDERADVFALAVVVWQALTGERPFAAPSAERSLALIEHGPKTKISKLVPAASGIGEEALMAALDPVVATRTASVADFANELTFALGDAEAGHRSLHHLVSQTAPDEDEDDRSYGERLPIAFRYPWLRPFIVRTTSALCCGFLTFVALGGALPSRRALLAAVGSTTLASAAWPPLGSALGVVAVLASLMIQGGDGVATVLLPALVGMVMLAWWVLLGVRSHHATPALLLPCCLSYPTGGVAWAGAFLPPVSALATSLASWAFAQACIAARSTAFDAGDTARALLSLAMSPAAWVAALSCGVAAMIASVITRRGGSTGSAVLGQVACCAVLVGSQVLTSRLENGGIWAPPTWEGVAVAVVLCMFASVAAALSGPAPDEQEEDWDELH
jgi:serine/threonine-protein kinase